MTFLAILGFPQEEETDRQLLQGLCWFSFKSCVLGF
jgi:hypothetical protein